MYKEWKRWFGGGVHIKKRLGKVQSSPVRVPNLADRWCFARADPTNRNKKDGYLFSETERGKKRIDKRPNQGRPGGTQSERGKELFASRSQVDNSSLC